MEKFDTFYLAFGSKISISTSIMLGWTKEPPAWWSKFDLAWGGWIIWYDTWASVSL